MNSEASIQKVLVVTEFRHSIVKVNLVWSKEIRDWSTEPKDIKINGCSCSVILIWKDFTWTMVYPGCYCTRIKGFILSITPLLLCWEFQFQASYFFSLWNLVPYQIQVKMGWYSHTKFNMFMILATAYRGAKVALGKISKYFWPHEYLNDTEIHVRYDSRLQASLSWERMRFFSHVKTRTHSFLYVPSWKSELE